MHVHICYLIILIYICKPIGLKRVAVSGSVNITGNASSANLTNLEEGTHYDVTVSPYIGGFQLGPPTNIIINTSTNGKLCVYSLLSYSFGLYCS